jgi:hypothetical protein
VPEAGAQTDRRLLLDLRKPEHDQSRHLHGLPRLRLDLWRLLVRLVIVESPYSGDIEDNVRYARACVRDCLLRGEAPIASHLLYTQPGILRDEVAEERQHGIDAGLAWLRAADASAVYTDKGISIGMQYGINAAVAAGRPVEYRSLEGK